VRSHEPTILESGEKEMKNGEQDFLLMLKLARLPLSLAATLAALPSISEIPFLD
jgi:hypothetical protein